MPYLDKPAQHENHTSNSPGAHTHTHSKKRTSVAAALLVKRVGHAAAHKLQVEALGQAGGGDLRERARAGGVELLRVMLLLLCVAFVLGVVV